MTNPFYCSKKWRSKRQYILSRDGFLCQECKKYGRNTEAKIVHHIKEIDDFPELKLKNNNLVSVCASCHNKIHPEKGGHKIRY
jgi:5-methylcytosine-specific restriction endonuclease McrA